MARKSRLARLIATAVAAVALASAAPASAQQPVEQDGLVNVNIQNVQVLVPVSVAANICDVNVGILARQERQGGAVCRATAESIASPGASDGGGGPVSQEGLVNVNVQGLTVFVPVSIAANICDVNVGVLAEQLREGGAECTATARSLATRGPGPGGGAR